MLSMLHSESLVLCFIIAAGGAAVAVDNADEPQPRTNLLNLVSLSEHPLARCNDGTPAVYYRRPLSSPRDTRKLLLYLEGGGLCGPGDPAVSCAARCANGSLLYQTIKERKIENKMYEDEI